MPLRVGISRYAKFFPRTRLSLHVFTSAATSVIDPHSMYCGKLAARSLVSIRGSQAMPSGRTRRKGQCGRQ